MILQLPRCCPNLNLLLFVLLPLTSACQLGNQQMSACLHRYLERDFSLVEDLLRRPPYGDNGHILIEENELDSMCAKLAELKTCYESMFSGCVAYVQYAQMKRVLKIMRRIYASLCGAETFQIKALIEGGYCIEYVRKDSLCSSDTAQPHPNETITFDLNELRSMSSRHRWPYTLSSMMRFELGADVCPYLTNFNQCLTPRIELQCREESRTVWRHSMDTILDVWCAGSATQVVASTVLIAIYAAIVIDLSSRIVLI